MPSQQQQYPWRRPSTTSSHESRDSNETYESMSTAPSSVNASPLPPPTKEAADSWSRPAPACPKKFPSSAAAVAAATSSSSSSSPSETDDVSPCTSLCPRASVDSYDSRLDSEEDLARDDDDEDMVDPHDDSRRAGAALPRITPMRPYLRQPEHEIVPSNPQTFGRLFPSMDRLSIRHDDLTPDGNMNLRVDTVVAAGSRRRPASTVQLFHLRMYDLARREFSLRRYCRDSGREVCKSKRQYLDPAGPADRPRPAAGEKKTGERRSSAAADGGRRPSITRSVSSALKVLAPRPRSSGCVGRTNTGSSYEADDERVASSSCPDRHLVRGPSAPPEPTNTIKLEFSNYARVDVTRRGARDSKRYEFEWWGHAYAWKRVVDRNLDGVVSFHLVRDGQGAPVAHVVPETRSPIQVRDEEGAGGWVPPAFMWISDPDIIDAVTDVADVIVATGLVALVDDCIKDRFQENKARRSSALESLELGSRALMQRFLGARRHSEQPSPMSPLRMVEPSY